VWSHVDDLTSRVTQNELRFGTRDAATGKLIGDNVAATTEAKLKDPQVGVAENLQDVANVNGVIKEAAQAQGVSVGGALVGAREAAVKLGESVNPTEVLAARAIQANARDLAKGVTTRVIPRTRKMAEDDAAQMLKKLGPGVKLEETVEPIMNRMYQRFYSGVLGRLVHGFHQGDLADRYRNWEGYAQGLQHRYFEALASLDKQYDKDVFKAAFGAARLRPDVGLRAVATADPEVAAAAEQLKPLMEHIFPLGTTDKEIIASHALTRNNIPVPVINKLFKEKGIPFQFKWKEGDNLASTISQMHKWNIKDPLDFLSKAQDALTEAMVRKTFAEDFVRRFGSTKPKPGWVRIKKSDAKMSDFLPDDVWFDPEHVQQMALFNRTFDMPTSYRGESTLTAKFMNNVVDPYLRIWKPSVTTLRPGFQIRNAMGDFMQNGLAGVWSPIHYWRAANIQRAIGRFNGDPIELAKLGEKSGKKVPSPTDVIFRVQLKNGKTLPMRFLLRYNFKKIDKDQ